MELINFLPKPALLPGSFTSVRGERNHTHWGIRTGHPSVFVTPLSPHLPAVTVPLILLPLWLSNPSAICLSVVATPGSQNPYLWPNAHNQLLPGLPVPSSVSPSFPSHISSNTQIWLCYFPASNPSMAPGCCQDKVHIPSLGWQGPAWAGPHPPLEASLSLLSPHHASSSPCWLLRRFSLRYVAVWSHTHCSFSLEHSSYSLPTSLQPPPSSKLQVVAEMLHPSEIFLELLLCVWELESFSLHSVEVHTVYSSVVPMIMLIDTSPGLQQCLDHDGWRKEGSSQSQTSQEGRELLGVSLPTFPLSSPCISPHTFIDVLTPSLDSWRPQGL